MRFIDEVKIKVAISANDFFVSFTKIVLLETLFLSEISAATAPFVNASSIKSCPSKFKPLIAINKSSFFIFWELIFILLNFLFRKSLSIRFLPEVAW